ncbi:MAG: hypothetical protein HQM03_06540 [Magnetococcales bacterium]|nr:hypothetical protein [Magnetococcales bacterium]
MAGSLGEILKAEDGGVQLRRVGFHDLLGIPKGIQADHFLGFRPDGRLPELTPPKKEPEISPEELHQRRLEQIEREVYQKVFAAAESAGLKLGEEKMEREIQKILPQLHGTLATLEQLHTRIFAASERFLVETTLVLIKELLAYELTIHPEEIAVRVKRLLTRAAGRREIVIRLSPGNARILSRLEGFSNLRIEADESLSPGAVRLESDFGGLEDNLENQLREVEQSMRAFLAERLEQPGVEDIAQSARRATDEVAARPPRPLAPDPAPAPPAKAAPKPTAQPVPPPPPSTPTPEPAMRAVEEAPPMPDAEAAMEWEAMEEDEEPAIPKETELEQAAPDEAMEWDIQEPEAQPEQPLPQEIDTMAEEALQQEFDAIAQEESQQEPDAISEEESLPELDTMTMEKLQQEIDALVDESVLQDLAGLTGEPVVTPADEATGEQDEWATLLGEAEALVRDEHAADSASEPDGEEIVGLVL